MQYKWLNKNTNPEKLIVFFNGWAMNESVVEHFEKDDFDILMINDYRDIDFDFSIFDFNKYAEKYLVCWSMGVYAVNLFKDIFDNFDKKIAINGTGKIIDDNYGINEKIYEVTVKFLNESSCDKFISNMFDNKNPDSNTINTIHKTPRQQNIRIEKSIDELKDELIAIQKIKLNDKLNFTKAIISNKDRIIPSKNQLKFWEKEKAQNNTEIEIINSTHCPFENYNSFKELIGLV